PQERLRPEYRKYPAAPRTSQETTALRGRCPFRGRGETSRRAGLRSGRSLRPAAGRIPAGGLPRRELDAVVHEDQLAQLRRHAPLDEIAVLEEAPRFPRVVEARRAPPARHRADPAEAIRGRGMAVVGRGLPLDGLSDLFLQLGLVRRLFG